MKIESKAVHIGDRKKLPASTPSATPIYTATTYFYDTTDQLDKVFGDEAAGESYSRYGNPTNAALEELVTALENGVDTLACSSGMTAIHVAVTIALLDRRKSVVAANAIYGATVKLLMQVLEPFGVEVNLVDICDLDAVQQAIDEHKPGCILMETISNPLLRVGEIDRIAEMARAADAALIVDNTFATPLLVRPLDLGAHIVVHSLTKYLSGHGDVLGGSITVDAEHAQMLRGMGKIYGPVLGPFESYLTMRGIKTFPLRMERQCANACRLASWLAAHPKVAHVNYPGNPKHPDAAAVSRLLPKDLSGAMVSFDLKDAGKAEVFACMDRLKMIVRGTSLGDVHTLALYPAISSHRDISAKQRERLGIKDSLIRLSVGIEAVEDIIADLEQAIG
ncbi:MAG TPA: PLP-dependent aspartate aminotransferase family protein [Bryobacteraceae bacterium]|nr:PLP-dependent aspartate aminotransferase family protein [Bryobacteraceae bacterium]